MMEVFSIAASLFSVALALFAIWMSDKQRKESEENFRQSKDVFAKLEGVMEKVQLLVSDNFQNLIRSITEQQGKMLESMKPKTPADERYVEQMFEVLRDDPQKSDKLVQGIMTIQGFNQMKAIYENPELQSLLANVAKATPNQNREIDQPVLQRHGESINAVQPSGR